MKNRPVSAGFGGELSSGVRTLLFAREHESLLPPGFRVTPIQDVGFDRLEKAFKLDFGKRYWSSREEFLTGAIGACILMGKTSQ